MIPEASPEFGNGPHGLREWAFIAVLCATQLFTQGALGYILMPLNHVSETFHQTGDKEAARMAWHVAGYSLTVGSFIIIAGRLGDMYGAKRIFVFGWIWFAASSLLCGFSALTRSPIFFDVTRALQGIGPVLLLPNALAIAGRTYAPGMKKNIVFSMIALSAPLGCAIGGLIGASIAQYWWWPWSAWLSALACSAVALTAYLVVPTVPKVFLDGEKSSFDWIGSVLAVSGLVLLNVSWNQAPIDGWSTPHVYVLLILGFISIGLFAWWEKRAERPLIDTSVFNARVAGILMCTGLGWSSFGVWFFYMFQFLAHMRGNTSLDSALQFGPGALSGVLAALFTAWAIPRVPVPWLLVVASVAYLLGCLLIALAPVKQSYWFNVFWSFVVMPWGMDISFPASALFVSDAVPAKHQGISAALVNTVVNYSISIGLGIAGTVEAQVVETGSVLDGYRAAQYTSVGLSGAGLVLSMLLAILRR